MLRFSTLAVAALMFVPRIVDSQEPELSEHLKPLQPLIGIWDCDTPLNEDVPGLGKKGDRIKLHLQFSVTRNGQAIAVQAPVDVKGRTIPFTDGFLTWDAEAKKIVGIDTFVNGGLSHYTIAAEGKFLDLTFHGATADGAATSGSVTYTIQDESTMVIRFREGKEGNEIKPAHGPYTFVRATSASAQYVEYFKPLLGKWKTRAEVDGKTVEGTYHSQLSPTKNCYTTVASGGGVPAAQSVDGYDPALRAWKVVSFNEAGTVATLIVHADDLATNKHIRAGTKGTYETQRTHADGTTELETGKWACPAVDGQQFVLELSDVKLNGSPRPNSKVTYERQPE